MSYIAPALPSATQCVKDARAALKRARTKLMLEKKCKKYGGRTMVKKIRRCRRDREKWDKIFNLLPTPLLEAVAWAPRDTAMEVLQTLKCNTSDLPSLSYSDTNYLFVIHSRRLKTLQGAVDDARASVGDCNHALERAKRKHKRSVLINTTVHNAQSAQAVADYFEAQDAGRVFVDAVRPWLTAAICPPPQLSHVEAHHRIHNRSIRCTQCRRNSDDAWWCPMFGDREYRCQACSILMCFQCVKDDNHVCPVW